MAGIDDIDIFDGSVGQMARRQQPKDVTRLSPAQIANLTASLAPGSASVDIVGEFPQFPTGKMTTAEMLEGPRSPSLAENLAEGEYFSGILQAVGGLGDAASVAPVVGPLIGSVLKTPRAIQRLLQVGETLEEGVERTRKAFERGEAGAREEYLILRNARDDLGEDVIDKGIGSIPATKGKGDDFSYRMTHTPTTPQQGAARLDDMTGGGKVFPDDIYSSRGLQFYGDPNNKFDRESFEIIQAVKGNPEAEVTVYRAVPKGVTEINPGDFVTLSPEYAKMHGMSGYGAMGDEAGDVISMKVKVKEVFSDGNDLNEFGFFPMERLQRAKDAGFDTDTVYYHATDKFGDSESGEFTQLRPSASGKLGPGIYLSPDASYTQKYIRRSYRSDTDKPPFDEGARVLPVFVRGKIGTREDFGEAVESVKKNASDKTDFAVIKRKAQEKMADDGFAGFKVQDELVIFDPKNIRSVNAKFEDLDSPELLKASGGAVQGFSKGGILDLIVKGDFDPRFDPRIKEQEMLRNLEAEIIASDQTQPMPRLALSELEGEDFVTSMTDRTRAGGEVKSINRVELVDPVFLPGGQDFMFNNPSAVWASAEKPSREILELARELKSESGKDPLYIPWRMAPTGGDFSTTTGELMLGYAAANMTKRTKKALDKAIRDYRTIGSMKGGKRVGAGRKIEGWKGLDDPSSVQVWRNTPDAVRKELMNMMDVQFRDKGGLSIGAARLINADPKQLTARDAGIQNVGRIFADADISSSTHPSYPFAVPGGGVGVLDSASEATVFDLLPQARFGAAQKPVKDPANPTAQEIRALQMKPYGGTITEDILRRMEARGVDVNSIVGLTGGALTFTLLSAGLITPQEVQAGGIKQFVSDVPTADKLKQAKEKGSASAPFELVLDALSGVARPIAGGLAGLAQFREDLPRRALGDLTSEQAAERVRAMREGVSEALDYEPTSELGRELSQRAREGIARLAAPAVRTVEPVVTGAVEQITDPQNVSPLGLLYRGGKYLYEDIFGEPEREAAKSAMDVAL